MVSGFTESMTEPVKTVLFLTAILLALIVLWGCEQERISETADNRQLRILGIRLADEDATVRASLGEHNRLAQSYWYRDTDGIQTGQIELSYKPEIWGDKMTCALGHEIVHGWLSPNTHK